MIIATYSGTHMLRLRVSVLIIPLILGSVTFVSAQVGGTLSGIVKDPSGGVIPGVNVTATNTVLGTMFTTVTDARGLYSFPKLTVGRYDVTLQIDGFKPQKR